MNDGSTDGTQNILDQYEYLFSIRSYKLTIIKQENLGQAAALKKALQLVEGEYIVWMDSDDILLHCCIRKKVEFLNIYNFDMVFAPSLISKTQEASRNLPCQKIKAQYYTKKFLRNVLLGKALLSNLNYMVRSVFFFDVVNINTLNESRYGQNYQVLIPLSYKARCGVINTPLQLIYARPESHSRKSNGIKDETKRFLNVYAIVRLEIDSIAEMKSLRRFRYKSNYLIHNALKLFKKILSMWMHKRI